VNRPELCENADEPHALNWLTPDFAVCPGCDLLYARQPGVLVWVYDPWAGTLATALAVEQAKTAAAELGYRPSDPLPLPSDDDLEPTPTTGGPPCSTDPKTSSTCDW